MALPPILYHIFPRPLPYMPTLRLQNAIHGLQLASRRKSPPSHSDYLFLLQHTPVYTAGRRQTESTLTLERERLTSLGADFVLTERGGQLTYHGPGQLVGYPLIDLGRTSPPIAIRDYICLLQRTLKNVLASRHGIKPSAGPLSNEAGVFVDAGRTKLASVGVQVRHRLTTHGIAMNVNREPLQWFGQIVACGLEGVKAGCIQDKRTVGTGALGVEHEAKAFAEEFGKVFGREMKPLQETNVEDEDVADVKALVEVVEEISRRVNEDKGEKGWEMRLIGSQYVELFVH